MSDIENIRREQTWKSRQPHRRWTSEGEVLKVVNREGSTRPSVQDCTSEISMIEERESERRRMLSTLAVPYRVLEDKLRSLSTGRQASFIKVPLIKKMPFGKHRMNIVEPKFATLFKKTRSIAMNQKKVIQLKKESGRIR
jgi:hypothetical protein